jgi:periplasmic divalent cation tolerance protein
MNAKHEGVIIVSTFPNERSIRELAEKLLSAKLCACVNFAKVRSMYSWKGRQEDQSECLALFKTTRRSATGLRKAIARMHPYEVPEIVELKIDDVAKPYLAWLVAETSVNSVAKKSHNAAK